MQNTTDENLALLSFSFLFLSLLTNKIKKCALNSKLLISCLTEANINEWRKKENNYCGAKRTVDTVSGT